MYVLPADSRLAVLEAGPTDKHGDRKVRVRCECGTEKWVFLSSARSGNTRSCGCLSRERSTKHGGKGTRLYRIWTGMRTRSRNPHHHAWHRYGGRGISICPEWGDFAAFRDWALANGYADNLTIDRIDNDGNYEPGNCQWLPLAENTRKARVNAAA